MLLTRQKGTDTIPDTTGNWLLVCNTKQQTKGQLYDDFTLGTHTWVVRLQDGDMTYPNNLQGTDCNACHGFQDTRGLIKRYWRNKKNIIEVYLCKFWRTCLQIDCSKTVKKAWFIDSFPPRYATNSCCIKAIAFSGFLQEHIDTSNFTRKNRTDFLITAQADNQPKQLYRLWQVPKPPKNDWKLDNVTIAKRRTVRQRLLFLGQKKQKPTTSTDRKSKQHQVSRMSWKQQQVLTPSLSPRKSQTE
jgi:hypothetical protein